MIEGRWQQVASTQLRISPAREATASNRFRCRIRKLSVFFCLARWFSVADAVLCERFSFYVSTLSWQSHWHMDVSRFWYHATLTRKDTLSGYSKCSTVMVLVAAAVTVQFISGCQCCFRILNCNVKCYVWSLWTFFSCLRGDKFHLRTTTNYFQSYGLIFF